MSDVEWDDRPPADVPQRLYTPVFRIKRGQAVFVRFLGPWVGCWLHYGPKHSEPCPGERGGCEKCPQGWKFWEGYAPALLWDGRMTLDEETKKSVRQWTTVIYPVMDVQADVLRQLKKGITGVVIEVKRLAGPGVNLETKLLERTVDPYGQQLPASFDVRPCLERMWKLNRGPAADQRPHIFRFPEGEPPAAAEQA